MSGILGTSYEDYDALGLAALVRRGEVRPLELLDEAIDRIERHNPRLNAVVSKAYDRAREQAEICRKDGVFAGVPFLIKDMVTAWEGNPMTWSCPYFKDLVLPFDMVLTRRLRESGLLPVGNTHCPELGWSLSSESALYGVTQNPWKHGVSAGGSSGGSAAAVTARMTPIADASDAAGSIRVPAAFNGLVGLKPSRGRITLSPNGVDLFCGGAQVHCVSRTVRDSAAFLDVTCGGLTGEPYVLPKPETSFLDSTAIEAKNLKIGFTLSSPDGASQHGEVSAAIEKTLKLLESSSRDVQEFDLKLDFAEVWQQYTDVIAVQTAALFGNMAPLVGREVTQADVSPTIWSMLRYADTINGEQHSNDVEGLRKAAIEIATLLCEFDVFVCPVLNIPPPPLGRWSMDDPDIHHYNTAKMMPDCVFTAPFNIAGLPAMSVPVHMSADGLPVGVQLVARHGDEASLFQVASQLEQIEQWQNRRPPGY